MGKDNSKISFICLNMRQEPDVVPIVINAEGSATAGFETQSSWIGNHLESGVIPAQAQPSPQILGSIHKTPVAIPRKTSIYNAMEPSLNVPHNGNETSQSNRPPSVPAAATYIPPLQVAMPARRHGIPVF